jgi:diguanylate cyclase (GGDEF)-like protein/PAS domain S-box-containing protein
MHRKQFSLQVLLWLVGAVVLLWSALVWDSHRTEDRALEQARRETAAWAVTFASQAQTTFVFVDQALVGLRQIWLTHPSDMAQAVLPHQEALADALLQVAVIDAKGYLVYSNLGLPKEPAFLGDREHFTVHQVQQEDKLFVSRPVKGRVSGKWSIQLTRPILQRGQFAGVIVISVDPDHFVKFYDATGFGKDGAARMVRDTGEIMARSSEQDKYVGKVIEPSPFGDPGAALQGSFRRRAQSDGVDRVSSYYRLPQYSLTVAVGRGIDETLTTVRSQQQKTWIAGVMVTFLMIVMAWLLMRNVERQKASHRALAASEERFRTIFDVLPIGISLGDRQGHIVDCNSAAERMLGVSKDEYLARNDNSADWQVFRPDGTPMPTSEFSTVRALAERRPVLDVTMEVRTPAGSAWLSASATPLDHRRYGVLGAFVDISERRIAERKLQLVASVFTHAREGIMITDAQGDIVDVNDAFSRITGYSREEALGNNPRILNSGRQPPEYYTTMWRSLIESGHWSGEVWNRRKSGEVYAEMQTVSAVRDASGATLNYVALFSDITPMKEHQQQLEHIAHYDALTHLPNRVLLADRLQQAIIQSQRRHHSIAVVFLDLDGFKAVNDSHGHAIGDTLLIALSHRMKAALREGDTLARIGGDEFVAILVDMEEPNDCEPVLARLLQAASGPVVAGMSVLQVSASMGVTIYPQDGADPDMLMRHADQAMYLAKQSGKNRYHLFDVQQEAAVKARRESFERIRQALDSHELVLYYQPKVDMRSRKVVGVEALIRWQHPERGLLLPAEFLPVIEDHPMSVEVGEWVIDTALAQMSAWQAAGLNMPVSVNIGAYQLQQDDFADRLIELLGAHPDVPPNHLELEVLETSALEDIGKVSQIMHTCHALGVRFALDDFGTGYSSLTYLRHLPAELIKIDQSFVRDMLGDIDDMAIVTGVIGLATAFGRHVIAEGVETAAHGTQLMAMGCELAQGYGIARPMPARDLPDWVTQWTLEPPWDH